MHLAYLNPVGVVGGAERVLLAAVRQVKRLRPAWRVSALLMANGPLVGELQMRGAEVVVVPMPPALAGVGDTQLRRGGKLGLLGSILRGMPAGVGFARTLRARLRELHPTLVHSHGLKTHLLAAVARPRGVPVVWHVHDFYSHRPVVGKLLRRLRDGVVRAVAISEAVAKDATSVLPGLPISTVPNAVDLAQFAPGTGQDLDALAGLPAADVPRVGLVATYANWKGHGVFLDAFAKLTGPARAYIVGGPIYATAGSQVSRAELEAQAARRGLTGRVGFVPFLANPAAAYRSLDVVVHASTRAEPFGLTVAEAMACGRAVIVSADGGAKELFTDGLDALGHPPGDVDALAAAMQRLLNDPALRQSLGDAARHTAEAKFDENRFGDDLIRVYEGLHV